MKIGHMHEMNHYYKDGHFVRDIDDVKGLDLLVIWGGTDINPRIYEQIPWKASPPDIDRDQRESRCVVRAISLKIPILGICRGSQLLCALLGGELWQHVDNHGYGSHLTKLTRDFPGFPADREVVMTTSHHQMMIPTKEMEILAYTHNRCTLKERMQGTSKITSHQAEIEPEIVFSSRYRALMIQGHPEYCSSSHEFSGLTTVLVKELLGVTLETTQPVPA